MIAASGVPARRLAQLGTLCANAWCNTYTKLFEDAGRGRPAQRLVFR